MTVPDFIREQHEAIYHFIFENLFEGVDWPDIAAVISDRQASTANTAAAYSALLPVLTCSACGGRVDQAIPLAAAWVLYDLASDVFDDLQDRDGKDRLWNRWAPGRSMAVGLGLISAGEICLARLDLNSAARVEITESLARTLMLAARGQGSDPDPAPRLPAYLNRLIAKSGIVFASITRAGARLCSSEPHLLQAMHDYGLALGILVQLRDDCRDLSPTHAVSDLLTDQHTLPVLYALSRRDHPAHPRLAELLDRPRDGLAPADVEEVCRLLAEMGAFAYSIAVAKVYEQKALAALQILPDEKVDYLKTYVSGLLNFPVPG